MGKSRICAEIAKHRPLKWQDVSKIAKDNGFINEYDSCLECPILDEDKVCCFTNDSSEINSSQTFSFSSNSVDGFLGARNGEGWKHS